MAKTSALVYFDVRAPNKDSSNTACCSGATPSCSARPRSMDGRLSSFALLFVVAEPAALSKHHHLLTLTATWRAKENGCANETVALRNIGRETESFLWFITQRYDSMAEYTLFTQAAPLAADVSPPRPPSHPLTALVATVASVHEHHPYHQQLH